MTIEEQVKKLEEMYDLGTLHGEKKLARVFQQINDDEYLANMSAQEIKVLIYKAWRATMVEEKIIDSIEQLRD